MVTKLLRVYNGVYHKGVKVHLNGNVYCIKYQQTSPINADISENEYMKIEIDDDEVERYVLKYHNYNIAINDALGKKNGVADYDVHTKWSNDKVEFRIRPDTLEIFCEAIHLGIYDSSGEPGKYYSLVTAKHLTKGGITVTGFEPGFETMEGDSTYKLSAAGKEKHEDEVAEEGERNLQEAPTEMKAPEA